MSISRQTESAGSKMVTLGLGMIILLAAAIAIAFFVNKVQNGGLEMLVVLLALLPALVMGFTVSVYQVPYILAIWAFAPELRRIIDWSYGEYQNVTILSILPLIATLTLILPIMRRRKTVQKGMWLGLSFYLTALAYSALIGLLHNGAAMFYELASYLVPLILIVYAAQRPFSDFDRDMILRSFTWISVVVALYGWFQYLTAPAWDTFWMAHSGMGSIGTPHPLQIRLFSTLNSPGPAAEWLGLALALTLVEKRWRTYLGWIAITVIASALALTLARGIWIEAAITVIVFVVLSPGAKRLQTMVTIVPILAIAIAVISMLPGGDVISARLDTLGSLQSDHSYTSRTLTLQESIQQVAAAPLGMGLGSNGISTKAEGGNAAATVLDNGFAAIYLTMGWLGASALFLGILLLCWHVWTTRALSQSHRRRAALAVAYTGGMLYTFALANNIPGLGGLLLWFIYMTVLSYKPVTVLPTREIASTTFPDLDSQAQAC